MPMRICLHLFIVTCLIASCAIAQVATAPSALEAGSLAIQITAVQGGAQYRNPGQTKWTTLAGPIQLTEGVELRTGPKGVVQFTVGTDQVYRVDRLSQIKVLRASLSNDGIIKTDVGMTYGRVSKDVDAPVRPHEDTIISPSSTLAVRGTRVSLYDQPPFQVEAVSLTGRAVFNNLGRQLVAFGAKNQGTAAVSAAIPDPAGNALSHRLLDPTIAQARTPSEQRLLADLLTTGAVVNISNPLTLPTVHDTGMPPTSALPTLVKGDLIFFTRWDTDTHVQMGLLSTAYSQGKASEFIFPALGLNQTATGGHILFDNLGGPGGGYEVIDYPRKTFASGVFDVSAYNAGNQATTVTFDAFITNKAGVLVPQLFFNPNAIGTPPLQEVTQTTAVGQTAGAIAFVTKQNPNSAYQVITFPGGGGFAPAARSSSVRRGR